MIEKIPEIIENEYQIPAVALSACIWEYHRRELRWGKVELVKNKDEESVGVIVYDITAIDIGIIGRVEIIFRTNQISSLRIIPNYLPPQTDKIIAKVKLDNPWLYFMVFEEFDRLKTEQNNLISEKDTLFEEDSTSEQLNMLVDKIRNLELVLDKLLSQQDRLYEAAKDELSKTNFQALEEFSDRIFRHIHSQIKPAGQEIIRTEAIDNINQGMKRQTKPAGRPIDKWNPIAWSMILDGNQTEEATEMAFEYWCSQRGIDYSGATKDDRRAFKKAMTRARKRWEKDVIVT